MAYNNGIRRRGSAPARECPQCGTSFYRTPKKTGAYCKNACRLAAGAGVQPRVAPIERYWPKVDRGDEHWLWTAGVDGHGYGAFTLEPGKQIGAHVFAYELASGTPVPKGVSVLHTCDVPTCVRNEPPGTYVVDGVARPCFGHLFLGTKGENNDDRDAKERQARGERQGSAKLTAALVREIRQRRDEGEPAYLIAADLGIGTTTVQYAATRKTWRHVE